jgi:hypothetical protein
VATIGYDVLAKARLGMGGKVYNFRHRMEDLTMGLCCGGRRARGGEEPEVHETASRAMEIL